MFILSVFSAPGAAKSVHPSSNTPVCERRVSEKLLLHSPGVGATGAGAGGVRRSGHRQRRGAAASKGRPRRPQWHALHHAALLRLQGLPPTAHRCLCLHPSILPQPCKLMPGRDQGMINVLCVVSPLGTESEGLSVPDSRLSAAALQSCLL